MVSTASSGDVSTATFVINVVGTPTEVEWEADKRREKEDFEFLGSVPKDLLVEMARSPGKFMEAIEAKQEKNSQSSESPLACRNF